MNYELAKQLKDAGFPQKTKCSECGMDWYDTKPTLSELIEACGVGNKYQFRLLAYWSENDTVWQADLKPFNNGEKDEYGLGSTPEEAVAKLWLELNKK